MIKTQALLCKNFCCEQLRINNQLIDNKICEKVNAFFCNLETCYVAGKVAKLDFFAADLQYFRNGMLYCPNSY